MARTKRGARSWESGFEVTPEGGDRRSEVRGQVSGDERLVNSRQKGRKKVLLRLRFREAPIGAREAAVSGQRTDEEQGAWSELSR